MEPQIAEKFLELADRINNGVAVVERYRQKKNGAMQRVLADILILEAFIREHRALYDALKNKYKDGGRPIKLRQLLLMLFIFGRRNKFNFLMADIDQERFRKLKLSADEFKNLIKTNHIDFEITF